MLLEKWFMGTLWVFPQCLKEANEVTRVFKSALKVLKKNFQKLFQANLNFLLRKVQMYDTSVSKVLPGSFKGFSKVLRGFQVSS